MRERIKKSNPTILIVDDEPVVRALLNSALATRGFEVLAAEDGERGVELYRQTPEAIDLVLLDVRMPGMDGLAALAAIRAINPTVLACFMTGDTGRYTGQELLEAGAATVFLKPFKLEALVQTLRDLLDGWNFPLGWPEPAHEQSGPAAHRNVPPFDASRSSPQLHVSSAEEENGERYNPHRAGPWQ